MSTIDAKMMECVRLVASELFGCIDCYDERIERFCDDRGSEDDTINRCFGLKLLEQIYDGDSDTGRILLLPAGRAALATKENGE